MASHPVIAVDGTAASGKSTFSRALAQRLGFVYVNTGAMYRGVTWFLQETKVPLTDPAAIARAVEAAGVQTHLEKGELVFRVGGVDPLPHVREGRVNEGVSLVAQVPEVRQLLVAQQQKLAEEAPLVMEGRDIGSVVFPRTPYKFYIDANAEVRAMRRDRQGETDAIQKRDTIDQSRKTSPLVRVTDAYFIDSSDVTVDEMVVTALKQLAVLGLKTGAAGDDSLPAAYVPLWDGPAPQSRGSALNDTPRLYVYLPEKAAKPAPAMLIVPGGGYEVVCYGHEGVHLAEWFRKQGVAAFVLVYRLPVHGYRHPVPLLDIQRAIRSIRNHAQEWNVNPAQVATLGFSAGGHLVTTLATHFDAGDAEAADPIDRESCRPDYTVAVYPVVTFKTPGVTHEGSKGNLLGPQPDPALVESLSNETQVTPQTSPTLLVHSTDDEAVPIQNSRLMLAALQRAGVPCALQEYPTGRHGFGFGPRQADAPAGWLDKVHAWLQQQGFRA
jgi:cytidylate kinase